MYPALRREIEQAAGVVNSAHYITSGNKAMIYRVIMASGAELIAKISQDADPKMLPTEGWMLTYLAEHSKLPVPKVHYASDNVLLMDCLPSHSQAARHCEEDAAEMIAALHSIRAENYGLERDTFIGSLSQPNQPQKSWVAFFGQQRLRYMARQALAEKRIDTSLMHKIDRLLPELPELIGEASPPSLIHGDLWHGNLLYSESRISGFIDPAIYYADPEIEIAFCHLFNSFGERFFRRYHEIHPMREGFLEQRCDLYNIYPILVHVRLLGGLYSRHLEEIVSRFIS